MWRSFQILEDAKHQIENIYDKNKTKEYPAVDTSVLALDLLNA
jgi:hypothetical protein